MKRDKRIYLIILLALYAAAPVTAATHWIRPAKDGVYGDNDGSSYDNARQPQSVHLLSLSPGDTVYFSGVCIYYEEPAGQSYTDIDIQSSGSAGSPITFRGDASSVNPSYPDGEVHGNYILTGSRVSWTDNGDNTWKTAIQADFDGFSGYFVFENMGGGWRKMAKVASSAACVATPGSYYSSDYKSGSDIYFHCSDDGDPDGRVSLPVDGHTWDFNYNDHIRIIDLDFYNVHFNGTIDLHDITITGSSVNDRMKVYYSPAGNNSLAFRDDSYNIILSYIDRGYGGAGFYIEDNSGDGYGNAPRDIWIHHCYVHDIGLYQQNSDAEGIGVNGGDNLTIEHNEFYNCGSAYTCYPYDGQTNRNHIIRYNYIHDGHHHGGARSSGIQFQTAEPETGARTGCEVYGNIIKNMEADDAPDWSDNSGCSISWHTTQVVFYNNTIDNCDTSFAIAHTAGGSGDPGSNVILKNNISTNPNSYHIAVYDNDIDEGDFTINSNYNCFDPDGAALFKIQYEGGSATYNFSGWQALSLTNCTFDTNSMQDDPELVDIARGKFAPATAGSPVINAGVDTGIGSDFRGNPIGRTIGAINYTKYGLF